MANKLYIFGIGGTGSRVIKALTMFFAAGIELANGFDTAIPIIIDPDSGNGDLNRTKEILKLYQEVRKDINQPDDFFLQELNTITNLVSKNEDIKGDSFLFQLKGTSNNKFKEFIDFSSLNEDDKKFIRELYSEKNLDSDLNIGFKGNPNMGSIVLNQFTNSNDFQKFGQSFNPGDAVFIINSIFGGTGAAGFPLLLKSLRNGAGIPNEAMVKNAPIGGITYLPYFKLNKGEIDSDTFLEKSKAAIDYYNRTIIYPKLINAIYFIGDDGATTTYENHVGEQEQKNEAHFLELAGALAILDFCKNINNATLGTTHVKEFGIENDSKPLTFDSLNADNSLQIKSPLTKFRLYTEYLDKGLKRALNVSRWTKKKTQLKREYFKGSNYINQIVKFNNRFNEWANELESNKPPFAPFSNVIRKNGLSLFKSLDISNCQTIDKTELSTVKVHTQLIKLFGQTTEIVIKRQNF